MTASTASTTSTTTEPCVIRSFFITISVLLMVTFIIVNLLAIDFDLRSFIGSLTANSDLASFISTLTMSNKLIHFTSLLTATGAAFFLLCYSASSAEKKRDFFLTSAIGGWTMTAIMCLINIFVKA